MDRREQRERRLRVRRRRAAVLAGAVVVVVVVVVAVSASGGGSSHPSSSSATTATAVHAPTAGGHAHTTATATGPAALEAGVEPWQLPVALSRESVVADGSGFAVLGGLDAAQSSVSTVYSVDPADGSVADHAAAAGTADSIAAIPRAGSK